MKKLTAVFTAIILMLTSLCINVSAHDNISVFVDGQQINFDVPPQIIDGRTMVPIRAIFEAIGAAVSWDSATQTATAIKNNTTVKMSPSNTAVLINDTSVPMDTSPVIIDGRTLAPARYAAESFGYTVTWDAQTKSVIISSSENSSITVHFIDVGQADAALITCGGQSLLIDGGNRDDSSLIYSYLSKQGINHLDYIIGTHAHEDHMGGLSGALALASIGKIYMPKTESTAEFYTKFKAIVSQINIPVVNPISGETFSLGNSHVTLYTPLTEDESNINNTSIMARIAYGNTSFLFTGDAEYDEEHDIINQNADLSADVLKVGHHGSNTSSSYVFLREIMPKYAVISVGKGNSYGHPHDEPLSRFRDIGATVYRTDLQGDIIFKSDGNTITVSTQKNAEAQTNPTQVQQNESTYIGNIRSKKYHRPSCSSLPSEKNRTYFDSKQSAEAEGYTPCGLCKP